MESRGHNNGEFILNFVNLITREGGVMVEKTTIKTEQDSEARREFLKKARNVAVAVPVATLLLAANSKKAKAGGGTVVVGGYNGNGFVNGIDTVNGTQ